MFHFEFLNPEYVSGMAAARISYSLLPLAGVIKERNNLWMLKQSNQGKLLLQGLKLPSIYSLKKWFILYVQRTAETFLNDTLLYKEKLHSAYILIFFFPFFSLP